MRTLILHRALLQILPVWVGMGRARERKRAMSDFKGRHFEGEIVLWAVRWYCRYGVSYRDLEQMLGERGVSVEHSTIYRRVQRSAPEIDKRLGWQWRGPRSARIRSNVTGSLTRSTTLVRPIRKIATAPFEGPGDFVAIGGLPRRQMIRRA